MKKEKCNGKCYKIDMGDIVAHKSCPLHGDKNEKEKKKTLS